MATKIPLVCCMLADLRPHRHSEHASSSPSREVASAAIKHRKSKISVKTPRGHRNPSVRTQTPVSDQHQSPVGRQKSKPSVRTSHKHGDPTEPVKTPDNNQQQAMQLLEPAENDPEHPEDVVVPRSKSRRVAAFVKRKLSRTKSAMKNEGPDDIEESEEAKRDIRRSLLSEVHGYDPDARLLDDVEDVMPVDCDESGARSPTGGKKTTKSEKRRSTLPSR